MIFALIFLLLKWHSLLLALGFKLYCWYNSCYFPALSGALSSILSDNGGFSNLMDQTNCSSTPSLLGLQPSANGGSSAFSSFGKGLSLGMPILTQSFLNPEVDIRPKFQDKLPSRNQPRTFLHFMRILFRFIKYFLYEEEVKCS